MARTPRKPGDRPESRGKQPTTRVPVAMPAETAAEYWLRTFRLRGFTLLVLGLVILAVVVLAPSLRILVEQRQTIAQLEAELEQRKQSVDELELNRDRWKDPAYIEAQARERLFYVYPGEYSYIVIDDMSTPTTSDGVPISDTIQTTQVDWVKSILSSVYTAGLTDAEPDELLAPVIEGGE